MYAPWSWRGAQAILDRTLSVRVGVLEAPLSMLVLRVMSLSLKGSFGYPP